MASVAQASKKDASLAKLSDRFARRPRKDHEHKTGLSLERPPVLHMYVCMYVYMSVCLIAAVGARNCTWFVAQFDGSCCPEGSNPFDFSA